MPYGMPGPTGSALLVIGMSPTDRGQPATSPAGRAELPKRAPRCPESVARVPFATNVPRPNERSSQLFSTTTSNAVTSSPAALFGPSDVDTERTRC